MAIRGLLFLVGSCEAYSLLAMPRAGTRVTPPLMSFEQLSKPMGLHLDFEEFRYSVGHQENRRPLGGDASTAISTGCATAATVKGVVVPTQPSRTQRTASRTFSPDFGDNTYERRTQLSARPQA